MTTKVSNVKPVICGIMHPVRESVIFSMNTCLTQAAHDTVQNVTVQRTSDTLIGYLPIFGTRDLFNISYSREL